MRGITTRVWVSKTSYRRQSLKRKTKKNRNYRVEHNFANYLGSFEISLFMSKLQGSDELMGARKVYLPPEIYPRPLKDVFVDNKIRDAVLILNISGKTLIYLLS